jgi:hypothetical protein
VFSLTEVAPRIDFPVLVQGVKNLRSRFLCAELIGRISTVGRLQVADGSASAIEREKVVGYLNEAFVSICELHGEVVRECLRGRDSLRR